MYEIKLFYLNGHEESFRGEYFIKDGAICILEKSEESPNQMVGVICSVESNNTIIVPLTSLMKIVIKQ